MSQGQEITEAAIDRAVASAFGRTQDAADPRVATALREAGFDDVQVRRGLEMWESGRYFGFEDVATSLSTSAFSSFGAGNRPVAAASAGSIAEAGKRLTEALEGLGATPGGVAESQSGRAATPVREA